MKEVDAERYLYTKQEWEQYQSDMEYFYSERAMSDISSDEM